MAARVITRGGVLRYCAVVILLSATHLAGMWFFSSGVYQGSANVPLRAFPDDVDFFFVLSFAATMIGLKYLLYELAVRAFAGNYSSPATRLCFYAGYVAALAFDMVSLFSSTKPIADAGLAVLAAVLQTPLVLIACAAVIAVIAGGKGPRPTTGAPRTP